MVSSKDISVKTLAPALRKAFEEAVDESNPAKTVAMQPLLEAFEAVGGIVQQMDYSQGYEIDYPIMGKMVQGVASLYKAIKEDDVQMARKPLNDRTSNFIKEILKQYPAPKA